MNARRATLTLGAAAGGLLATAFLQTAVASATPATNAITDLFGFGSGTGAPTDPFGGFFGGLGGLDGFGAPATGTTAATAFGLIDPSQETVLTVSGLPPLDQQVEGYSNVRLPRPGQPGGRRPVGTVNTDVSTLTTPIGFTNTEYLVTSSSGNHYAPDTGTDLTRAPELPAEGTTYDIARFDGFENIYSSVAPEEVGTKAADAATIAPGAGQDLVSDTFVTPFGSFDLTPLIGDFNASSGLTHDLFVSLIDPSGITGFTGVDRCSAS